MTRRFCRITILAVTTVGILAGQFAFAQASAGASTGFPPLDQWRSAVLAGDAAALRALYSVDPAAQVMANGVAVNADADMSFWLGLRAQSMKLQIVRMKDRPGRERALFSKAKCSCRMARLCG